MELAPIVLFVFNRPEHTQKTIKALQNNKLAKDSDLFVFSDGPRNKNDLLGIETIRKDLKDLKGFKTVNLRFNEFNKGLANSIISGVTEIINKYKQIIVLEDDLITSHAFLNYMNKLLNFYKNKDKIFSIAGYNHPQRIMKIPQNYPYDIYFNPRPSSWGWGTWKDRWETVDWEVQDFNRFIKDEKYKKEFNKGGEDLTNMLNKQMKGKLDSWAIRWCYHHFKHNALSVYPTISFIENIGIDKSGTHSKSTNRFRQAHLNNKMEYKLPETISINNEIMNNFRKIYRYGVLKKLKLKIVDRI